MAWLRHHIKRFPTSVALLRSLLEKVNVIAFPWEKYEPLYPPPRYGLNSVIFWPLTRPKMPFKVMHRKEVTHSNGSYERKSRGRKLANEMGRGKKCPWYTHRLTHRKRVTSELHDSYFRLMTFKHAISKIEWALNYYIAQSRQKSSQLSWRSDGVGGEMW